MYSVPGGCHAADAQVEVRDEAGGAVKVQFYVLVPGFSGVGLV